MAIAAISPIWLPTSRWNSSGRARPASMMANAWPVSCASDVRSRSPPVVVMKMIACLRCGRGEQYAPRALPGLCAALNPVEYLWANTLVVGFLAHTGLSLDHEPSP
jgi:hypothetical protein